MKTKFSTTTKRIHELITNLEENKLIPNPEFQRRLVWTTKDKEHFLNTILEGYPFPEVYVSDGELDPQTARSIKYLVDGQQRLTTIYQYFQDDPELKLTRDFTRYKNLSPEQQNDFLEYTVVVRDLGHLPIEEIREIFNRINSTSYALKDIEKHNASYNGAFITFAKELASDSFFERNKVFTYGDVKRMEDVSFCITVIISIMSNYFNRKDLFEEYLEQYNDEFLPSNELNREIQEVFAFLDRCEFNSKSRAWKKAELLVLIVEVHRALFKFKVNLEPTLVSNTLNSLFEKVDNFTSLINPEPSVVSYYETIIGGTADRIRRVKRAEIISKLLKGEVTFNS